MIRRTADEPGTWFLNGLVTPLATTTDTNGAYHLSEQIITAASNPPPHVHLDEDEAFFVLEGELEVDVDGETSVVGPGAFAFTPRGSAHTFRVTSDVARVLVVCSGRPTANFADFVDTMGEPAPSRTLPEPSAPDLDRLVRVAGENGIVFV